MRQRYVDLIVRPEARTIARQRIAVVRAVRTALERRGFLEVETPMLQTLAGGAAARPFVTHSNALDADLYLRIAPELFLKRCLVGGFETVFELNRNFPKRRRGFNAFAGIRDAGDVPGDGTYDDSARRDAGAYSGGSRRGDWHETTCHCQTAPSTISTENGRRCKCIPRCRKPSVKTSPRNVVDHFWRSRPGWVSRSWAIVGMARKTRRGTLGAHCGQVPWRHRTFVRDFPVETTPLTRQHRSIPGVTEKWDLYLHGVELATGYSEFIDPVVQRERFADQARAAAAGDDEAMLLDEDFLAALEFGMPPCTGTGMGIDRLLMCLTAVNSGDCFVPDCSHRTPTELPKR